MMQSMRGLHARYRHTFVCGDERCQDLIAFAGNVSDALSDDGAPIDATKFDYGSSHAFVVACKSAHVTRLAAPRDIQLISGMAEAYEGLAPPITLIARRARSSAY